MRYSKFLSGMGALLLALSAGIATAGPGERNATSKALGDMQGRSVPRQMNRAYSYAPATAAAAPATTPEPAQAAAPSSQGNDNSIRSFSYQAAPMNNAIQMNRRAVRTPGFLRADRKALNEY